MALENRLDLRLSQRLILTPQLQLAIKLLQHTQLELSQAINTELMENPFLEEVHEDEEEALDYDHKDETLTEDWEKPDNAEGTTHLEHEEAYAENSLEESEQEGSLNGEYSEIDYDKLFTFTVDDYFEDRGSDGRDLGYFAPDVEEMPSYETFYAKKTDLYEHLLWQLRLSQGDEYIKRIAEAVIANLDDDGYLRVPEQEIADLLKVDVTKVVEAIKLVQTFDPPGVAARDLRECLLIQLDYLGLKGSIAETIVREHLTDIQNKKHQLIAKKYGITLEEVMSAMAVIERLEPRPGRQYSSAEVGYIVPDVFIEKVDGQYRIIINDEGIPKLTINNHYKRLLSKKEALSKEERDFLKDKLRRAIELKKGLEQRNRTIYRVTESILKFQRDFFDFGVEYIKPLNLKDVAMDINMHESTVSRVTSNKYLSCPHGVFSFRYFFSSSVSGDAGEVSSTLVKELIKQIIASEDPHKPLSDEAISKKLLQDHKITIARRTVAKYREELRLPPQNRRKKLKI